MKYLLEETFNAQTKWYFIGLHLDLTHSMLSAIKSNYPSSDEQYTEMLFRWINGGSATVKRLIDALEANTVQMNGIAKTLQEKYAQQEGTVVFLQIQIWASHLLFCGTQNKLTQRYLHHLKQ